MNPIDEFHSEYYLLHNQKRLEHLESLALNIPGSTLLEVGAGIGDHTSFFIERGCQVVTTEGRTENLEILRSRYPNITVKYLDLERSDSSFNESLDIVYCYGILYHLANPAEAIAFMSEHCQKMLLLETCVFFGDEAGINHCIENKDRPSQSIYGKGCRPARKWVYNQLKQYFEFVYMPLTQPDHQEFPIDWSSCNSTSGLTRAIYIASRQPINNPVLFRGIPTKQRVFKPIGSKIWLQNIKEYLSYSRSYLAEIRSEFE